MSEIPEPPAGMSDNDPAVRDALGLAMSLRLAQFQFKLSAAGFELGIDYCNLGTPQGIDVVLVDSKTGKTYYINHPVTSIRAEKIVVPDDLSGLITEPLDEEPEESE